jgi:predicted permease
VYPEGQFFSTNESGPATNFAAVDPSYFATMKIPVVRGRAFTDGDADRSPLVAIINEAMAARFWPNQDAIGRRFRAGDSDSALIEVVGVTRQGKYGSPAEEPASFFYLPQAQAPTSYRVLQIRASVAPEVLIPAVETQIHELAPELPLFGVETMEQTLQGANGLLLFRIGTNLTAALGSLGLGLAVVGVYGVISYVAAQRTREIGVRMALGADRKDILRLVLRHGVKLVGIGVLVGLLVTYLVSHAIASLLLGVGPGDPLTLVSVPVFLAAVGLVASYIPARRAMQVDPIKALNHE